VSNSKVKELHPRDKVAPQLHTQTDLSHKAVKEISEAMNVILADAFALYLKIKNFHWHMSGPNFRDYHLMLDDQGDEVFATTDEIAERVRKLGATTLRSIGQIKKLQTIEDNNEEMVGPHEMLLELMDDNKKIIKSMRKAHKVCDDNDDVATASLLENYIDAAEKRNWFLFEISRNAESSGH
jgi:starvation-inducible DNA-binding protein